MESSSRQRRSHAPRTSWRALWLVPFLVAADTDETSVRLARVEGALASVHTDASLLAEHAKQVVGSGHFSGMAQLAGDAFALHRQVASARLAVDFFAELDQP